MCHSRISSKDKAMQRGDRKDHSDSPGGGGLIREAWFRVRRARIAATVLFEDTRLRGKFPTPLTFAESRGKTSCALSRRMGIAAQVQTLPSFVICAKQVI